MNVSFYNFSKKSNSTAQPPASALIATLACNLKDGCTVTSPQIRVAWAANNMLPTYAYIPDWGRYYFVRDIEYAGSALIFRLEVDPLASYKAQIGASTQYVVRSASSYDTRIIDSLYPTKTRPAAQSITSATIFAQGTAAGGTYVLGIKGQGGTGASKGVTYYAMDAAAVNRLTSWLNSNTAKAIMAGDLVQTLQVALGDVVESVFHMTEYIASCIWLPIRYGGDYVPVKFGEVSVDSGGTPFVTGIELDDPNGLYVLGSITIPAHPQAATYGEWMNSAPFSSHTLFIPSLGGIPLSSAYVSAGDVIDVTGELSMIDGTMVVDLWRNRTTDGKHFARYVTNIGVSIPLSEQRSDVMGAINTVATTVTEIKNSEKFSEKMLAAANGVVSGLDALKPHPQMLTAGGEGYHRYGDVLNLRLTSVFAEIPGIDAVNHGRPLCVRTQIGGLSGYVQTSGAALALAATDSERNAITAQMDAGFFYE